MKNRTENYVFSERLLDKATSQGKRYAFIHDRRVIGLSLRVMDSGTKTFYLRKRVLGKDQHVKIGAYPSWSISEARERAMELIVQMDKGINPAEQRRAELTAPTFEQLWAEYYEPLRLKTKPEKERKNQRSMYRDYIGPAIGRKRVKNITTDDIIRLHQRASETAPVRANRVLQVVGSCFNLAVNSRLISINPAKGVKKNPEFARERYLTDDELERFVAALDNHPNQKHVNIIRLLMLTGSRCGEVLGAKWEMFDLERGLWRKPARSVKQRRASTVPLSDATVALLRKISNGSKSPYVFPQDNDDEKSTVNIRKCWNVILGQARLSDFRIHDLRHDYASALAMSGVPLAVIGKLLGHTQTATTARYAHLAVEALKPATRTIEERVMPRS